MGKTPSLSLCVLGQDAWPLWASGNKGLGGMQKAEARKLALAGAGGVCTACPRKALGGGPSHCTSSRRRVVVKEGSAPPPQHWLVWVERPWLSPGSSEHTPGATPDSGPGRLPLKRGGLQRAWFCPSGMDFVGGRHAYPEPPSAARPSLGEPCVPVPSGLVVWGPLGNTHPAVIRSLPRGDMPLPPALPCGRGTRHTEAGAPPTPQRGVQGGHS